jgi:hypothetical protein
MSPITYVTRGPLVVSPSLEATQIPDRGWTRRAGDGEHRAREYRLSDKGTALWPAARALLVWGRLVIGTGSES